MPARPDPQPMTTFDPTKPVMVHEQTNDVEVEWVPVTLDKRFTAIEQHQVDLLCGAESATLERRKHVDFSIPFFPGGVGVAIRKDASAPLKDVLSGTVTTKPAARGVALVVLRAQTFGASAPLKDLLTKFGFTPDRVAQVARECIAAGAMRRANG